MITSPLLFLSFTKKGEEKEHHSPLLFLSFTKKGGVPGTGGVGGFDRTQCQQER